MTTYVFLGPTLSVSQAKDICDAVFLPPVAQGDIAALLRHQPKAIAIIDGYYENVPSVWHKEILLALARGIPVFGAASLGALRAAECHTFGMQGVGKIFSWYRDGVIDADDEVAVRHVLSERGYRATNVALVNVRATLDAAMHAGALNQDGYDHLLQAAIEVHYTQRTLGTLAEVAANEVRDKADWLQLLKENWVDQKQADAIELLQDLAKLSQGTSPNPGNLRVNATTKLQDLLEKDAALTWQNGVRVTPQMLADYMRVIITDFPDFEDRALLQAFAYSVALDEGLEVDADRLQRLPDILQKELGDFDTWCADHHMTLLEGEQFWQQQLLISEAFSVFELAIEEAKAWKGRASVGDLIRQARLEGCYGAAFEQCLAREVHLRGTYLSAEEHPSIEALHHFFCRMHSRFEGMQRELVAHALGFPDQTAYLYEVGRLLQFEPVLAGMQAAQGSV
jgi:hypothetical protein